MGQHAVISSHELFELEVRARPFYRSDKTLRYHVWSHIEQTLETHERLFGEPEAEVKLALLYHDAVYVPKAPPGVNEKLSALVFQRQATDCKLQESLVKEVMTLIEFTEVRWHLSIDLEADLDFIEAQSITMSLSGTVMPAKLAISLRRVLDCDLASLATEYTSFMTRQDLIVHEFLGTADISLEQLAAGRRASALFLLDFLKKPSIYLTAEGKEAFEERARENITLYARSQGVYNNAVA